MVEDEGPSSNGVNGGASRRTATEDDSQTEAAQPVIAWKITFEEWARGLEENRARARRLLKGRNLDRFPRTRPRSPDEAEWLERRESAQSVRRPVSGEDSPGPRRSS